METSTGQQHGLGRALLESAPIWMSLLTQSRKTCVVPLCTTKKHLQRFFGVELRKRAVLNAIATVQCKMWLLNSPGARGCLPRALVAELAPPQSSSSPLPSQSQSQSLSRLRLAVIICARRGRRAACGLCTSCTSCCKPFARRRASISASVATWA